MDSYYWLGFVAGLAALAQGWMLYKARSHTSLTSAFTLLSLVLIFQHALEFVISLLLVVNPSSITPYMHLFMTSLYMMALAMMNVGRNVADSRLSLLTFKLLSVLTICIAILHAGGLLFGEFRLTEYSVISTPGKYQGVWHMYAAILMTAVTGTLLGGIFSDEREKVRRSWVAITAFSPIIFCVIGVVLLQVFGFEASTAIALPIASSLMLAILLLEERNEFIAFEENLRDQWARLLIKLRVGFYVLFKWQNTNRKELLRDIDSILVTGAMKRKKTTIDAAEFLNIPRNTLNNLRQKEANSTTDSSKAGQLS